VYSHVSPTIQYPALALSLLPAQAIIDVHKLMEEAETITGENKTKKAGAAAEADTREEAAQDASAKSAYGPDGKRAKRRISPDSSKHKAITVVKWAEEADRNDAEVLAECRAGKVPAGFRCAGTSLAHTLAHS
jgi:hypothetical protein